MPTSKIQDKKFSEPNVDFGRDEGEKRQVSSRGLPELSNPLIERDVQAQQGFSPWIYDYINKVVKLIPGIIAYSVRLPTRSAATSPANGDTWYDSTQKTLAAFLAGIKQMLVGVIFTQTADKNINTSNVEVSILGTGVGGKTLPANFLLAGKTLRVRIEGFMGSTLTPTIRIKFKLGAIILVDTGAVTLVAITGTNRWIFEAIVTCRTTGATGTTYGQGQFLYFTAASTIIGIEAVASTTVTLDTTASAALDVTVQWGTSDAANTITSTNCVIEAVN